VCQIETNDLAAFGHVKVIDPLEGPQDVVAGDRLLGGVLNRALSDSVLREKLSRALAALSSGSVVQPVDGSGSWCHWFARRR
jgi:hypothetical protein